MDAVVVLTWIGVGCWVAYIALVIVQAVLLVRMGVE